MRIKVKSCIFNRDLPFIPIQLNCKWDYIFVIKYHDDVLMQHIFGVHKALYLLTESKQQGGGLGV